MVNKDFEDLHSKVTDLNQRMYQVEKQQTTMNTQINNIAASIAQINNKSLKKKKVLVDHVNIIGIVTTVAIIIALLLFNIFK